MPDEHVFYGTASELYKKLSDKEMKGEFVIVIEGRDNKAVAKTTSNRS
jgi:16S rRNA C1402 (ribose-2'-O) methylase RsmI